MKAEQTVDVTINYRGHDGPGKLGKATRACYGLTNDGDWVPTGGTEVLFGYCDALGYLTHMSYTLNTHRHETWNEWYDDLMKREYWNKDRTVKKIGLDKFYLDAGGNGCPMYVMMDEMKRAMIELGLYHVDDINTTAS